MSSGGQIDYFISSETSSSQFFCHTLNTPQFTILNFLANHFEIFCSRKQIKEQTILQGYQNFLLLFRFRVYLIILVLKTHLGKADIINLKQLSWRIYLKFLFFRNLVPNHYFDFNLHQKSSF